MVLRALLAAVAAVAAVRTDAQAPSRPHFARRCRLDTGCLPTITFSVPAAAADPSRESKSVIAPHLHFPAGWTRATTAVVVAVEVNGDVLKGSISSTSTTATSAEHPVIQLGDVGPALRPGYSNTLTVVFRESCCLPAARRSTPSPT